MLRTDHGVIWKCTIQQALVKYAQKFFSFFVKYVVFFAWFFFFEVIKLLITNKSTTKSNEWDTLVQAKHLTESRQSVRDGRCSWPTSPTSFTLNPVGADVRSTLSERLFIDSIEWLCKITATQSGTAENSVSVVHWNCRGVFLYILSIQSSSDFASGFWIVQSQT